jgi:hypothetical protein
MARSAVCSHGPSSAALPVTQRRSPVRAAGSVLVLLTLAAAAGCGNVAGNADREVNGYIEEALPKLGGTPQDVSDAQSLLAKAAAVDSASPAQRIHAKVLQGQAELQAAELMQPKIDTDAMQIRRLGWDIASLAGQLQMHNQIAAALGQQDPAQLQAELKQDVSAVQGSAGGSPDWVKTGDNSVHTLASTNDTLTSLQSQASDLSAKAKSLTDERDRLQLEGDDLTQKSELAKGDQSVALFKRAADDRRKSDELSLEIDQTNIALSRVQGDIAIHQGQQTILNQAIAAYGQQSGAADAQWATAQKQIDAQHDAAKTVLGDETEATDLAKDPTGGMTIAAKAATLARLAQDNASNRDAALPHVNTAIQCFRDAESLARTVQTDLTQRASAVAGGSTPRPETDAWNATRKTLDPSRYQLLQAQAQLESANLFAGQAAEAQLRQQLATMITPLLDADKLSLPAALQDSDNRIANAARTGVDQANAAYKAADDLLDGIIEGSAPEEQKKAAQQARIFADYDWYLWDQLQNQKSADDHLKSALAMRDAVLQNNTPLHHLPPELAVAPAAATPGGGPAPAPPQ